MYNGKRIKELLTARNLTNKQLLQYLGVEANASLTQLTAGNPSAKKLEKVADFFGVSMDVFFDRDIQLDKNQSTDNYVKHLEDKIILLENLIEEKDRNILLLEQINKILSGTNKGL